LAPETEAGESLTPARIVMTDVASGKDFGPMFKPLTANGVPLGYYDLTISKPGYKNYYRRLSVFQPETTVRVPLRVSVEQFNGAEHVEGVIDSVSASDTRRWVVLFPLSGSPGEILEAPVDAGGRFSFISPGRSYLLAVVQGETLLACRKLNVGHDTPPIRIKLRTEGVPDQ
jgi:hypothetical protein